MPIVSAENLRRFISEVFVARGMAPANAQVMADSLVWANLRGVDSHGVVRLQRYLEMIDEGLMNVVPAIRIETRAESALSIHADKAPGAVAMRLAADHLLKPAQTQGVAMALVSAMTHTGALGYYTSRLAEAGLASIAMSASVPLMPYHGAAIASLGTNPLSLAVPVGDESRPLVLDMASSVVSLGKLIQARRNGTSLEPGWFVDADGNPTTDAARAKMPLPFAGAKGSGLSLMIECFTSVLSGYSILSEALQQHSEPSPHRQSGMIIAIHVPTFIDLKSFYMEVQRLSKLIKTLPRVRGVDCLLLPGERGYLCMTERQVNGIPLPSSVCDELNSIGTKLNVVGL
jgi:LDH2 family malate/lactate/ureidoglycolate dehydrogenase